MTAAARPTPDQHAAATPAKTAAAAAPQTARNALAQDVLALHAHIGNRAMARLLRPEVRKTPGRVLQRQNVTRAPADLLDDPTKAAGLPLAKGTEVEVVAMDLLGLHGPNSGNDQWIQVKALAGPHKDKSGWVKRGSVELAAMPLAEAKALFDTLKKATFTSAGKAFPVPYFYPIDGCYARAHVMAELLTAAGYRSEKVFAEAKTGHVLEVPTPYAADTPAGKPTTVQWGYHVAPLITLATGEKYVMDPSIFDEPKPLQEWLSTMGPKQVTAGGTVPTGGGFKVRALADLANEFAAKTLPNEDRVYTTPRTQYFPVSSGGHVPGREGDVEFAKAGAAAFGSERLAQYAALATVHQLAAEVRKILNGPPAQVVPALKLLFNKAPGPLAKDFAKAFPKLIEDVEKAVGVAEAIILRISWM
jgi:hypothetical protein